MKRTKLPVYILLSLAMCFWGMSYIWINIVYRCYKPVTTVFLRLVIATSLMLVFSWVSKKLQRIEKGDFHYFLMLSVVQPFLYFLCESYGLQYVSPTVAVVIISTIPLFTPFAASYFFKEKLSWLNIIGMIMAFAGVLTVIIKEDFSLSGSPLGFVLLFLAVMSGVTYTIMLKKISLKYNPLTVVTYQNLLGIIGFLPLFLVLDLGHFLKAVPTQAVLISLGLLILLPTLLSNIMYTYSVKELGASRSSMFSNTMPVFTAIFAWLLLGEAPTVRVMVGIFVVITGLFISQMKMNKK
jgi:drug/metabolite transporter (DMT)-like permease